MKLNVWKRSIAACLAAAAATLVLAAPAMPGVESRPSSHHQESAVPAVPAYLAVAASLPDTGAATDSWLSIESDTTACNPLASDDCNATADSQSDSAALLSALRMGDELRTLGPRISACFLLYYVVFLLNLNYPRHGAAFGGLRRSPWE